MTLPLDTIICGDNATVMATWPDACIDMTVTSPPYDNLRTYGGHAWDFEAVAQQLWRVTKPGGVVVWVVADATIDGSETGTSFRQALRFKEIGFRLHDTMIWSKPNFSAVGALQNRYAPTFEFMFVLSKDAPKTFNPIKDRKCISAGLAKYGTIRCADGTMKEKSNKGWVQPEYGHRFNVWNVSTQSTDGHPAPFPDALARDHILSWSNEGDVVLDPFNGSGTTTKMARAMGRHWIGVEVNAEYCEIASRRMAQQLLPVMGPD